MDTKLNKKQQRAEAKARKAEAAAAAAKAAEEAAATEAARVAAEEAAKAAATPVAVAKTGKFRGLGSVTGIPAGLRRMEFQDRLLAWNEAPDNRLTDAELAAIMDREHPGGVHIRPDHMRAIRRLYNEGKHTKNGRVPETPSVEYGANKTPLGRVARKTAVAS